MVSAEVEELEFAGSTYGLLDYLGLCLVDVWDLDVGVGHGLDTAEVGENASGL